MDSNDYKRYNILENILHTINRKYVALPAEVVKRNNKLLQVSDRIIQILRNKSVLFDNLFETKFYGGSFYDGLKVGDPSEYDMDCVLCLPKIAEPTVVTSDKPGYVHIVLKNMKALEKKVDEKEKFIGLDKLLEGNRLSTKKVRSWIEGLMTQTGTKMKIEIDGNECNVKYKVVKNGPALTIKLEGDYNNKNFSLDVDLVPCFKFFVDQWPEDGYKGNPSNYKNTFFVVPKSPCDDDIQYWRLSFQEQERELISNYSVLKPVIRLIKKIRDRHQHKIASYYIKTIFLWELEKMDKDVWCKSLSFVLVMMLKKYAEYLNNKSIPYYWNESNNLIENLSDATIFNIEKKITNICDNIERICSLQQDVCLVVQFFLTPEELDPEVFKQELFPKQKILKQLTPAKPSKPLQKNDSVSSESSSGTSTFEEISKMMLDEPSLEYFGRLERSIVKLTSEQKRMFGMLEALVQQIEEANKQIKEIKIDMKKNQLVNKIQNELIIKMIGDMDRKVDGIKKNMYLPVDEVLGIRSSVTSFDKVPST